MDQPQIVVGIDGSASSSRALRWAARQAERTGRNLLVAYLGEAAERLGNYGYGEDLAANVVALLTREHPALLAHTVVIDGDPTRFLLRAADRAAMLVLGRGQPPTLTSLGGSVAPVLARSECPVVISGDPAVHADGDGRIVLGVSGSPGGVAAMRFACAEGVRAGVAVLALRSTSDPDRDFAGSAPRVGGPAAREPDEQSLLDRCLDEAVDQFPGVAISGRLTAEAIRFALARESHDAVLIVLGCGPPDDLDGRRLGPTALVAVHSLMCAVAVVGPGRPADPDPGPASGQRAEKANAVVR